MNVIYPIDNYRVSSTSVSKRISLVGKIIAGGAGRANYPIANTVDEFTEYDEYDCPDWDGYGAAPITKETVQAARAFQRLLPMDAPQPDIAPGGDGTIGFEWRSGSPANRTMILVDVGPGDIVTARRVNGAAGIVPLQRTHVKTGARALVTQLFS